MLVAVQLVTRLAYLIGRPAVCCGVQCCPFVRVSCRSPNSTSPTRTTRCVQVAIASSQHPRPTRPTRPISSRHVSDILAGMSRGCYEETASVECHLYSVCARKLPLSQRPSHRRRPVSLSSPVSVACFTRPIARDRRRRRRVN